MQNTISLPTLVIAIVAVLELLWIVRLLDFGKLIKRSNEQPKFGANENYTWVQVRKAEGGTQWLAMTDNELAAMGIRAANNEEDQP